MIHDYARNTDRYQRTKAKPKASVQFKPWMWICFGLIVGVFVAVTGYRFVKYHQSSKLVTTAVKSSELKATAVGQPAPATFKEPEKKAISTEPTFDFYTILPENEAAAGLSPQVPTQAKNMMLQISTYQDEQKAQSMKVKLLLMGLSPKVTKTLGGWYRVELGPIKSFREGEALRRRLEKQGIVGSFIRQITMA